MEAEVQNRINTLVAEIRHLEREIKIPNSVRGLIGGALAGYLLGGVPGALGLGLYGSKRPEYTPEQVQYIMAEIDRRKAELEDLMAEQGIEGDLINVEELDKVRFRVYEFDGKWHTLIGNPSKNFHAIVYGIPKSGKSIMCVQLANYLAHNFGKVLYIAAEEGYGQTLQQKFKEWATPRSNELFISDKKTFEGINSVAKGFDFIFIDSVNYAHIDVDELEALKAKNPAAAFITIFQATKGGDFRGSQEYAHNCDVVINVADGIAYGKGRFAPEGAINVFEE